MLSLFYFSLVSEQAESNQTRWRIRIFQRKVKRSHLLTFLFPPFLLNLLIARIKIELLLYLEIEEFRPMQF